MSSKEAVRQILEREGNAMESKDIVERAKGRGLRAGQIQGALQQLKKDGTIEKVKRGIWRIAAVPESRQMRTPDEPPDVEGLTAKETVFQILAHMKKPMKKRDIDKWLEANDYEPLNDGQISGAFYDLSTNHVNMVERVEYGTYRVHKKWNGQPLKTQKSAPIDSQIRAPNEPQSGGVVIPCFGLHWKRNLVSWSVRQSLLGVAKESGKAVGDAVNFANQTGVYVLYQWPQVNYVGRTTCGNLFQRLKSHDADPDKDSWDQFSWFGLSKVDDDGQLRERGQLSIADEAVMMETLLIKVLTPPDNMRNGEGMGTRYFQVPDPMVEEREQETLVKKLKQFYKSL